MERISGQIDGCVAMCRNPENESEAQPRLVAVDDSFQGKGIGKMMFKVLEEEAKARGFKSVLINGRIRVTDFYLKLGYQPLSDKVHLSSSVPHKYFRKSLS